MLQELLQGEEGTGGAEEVLPHPQPPPPPPRRYTVRQFSPRFHRTRGHLAGRQVKLMSQKSDLRDCKYGIIKLSGHKHGLLPEVTRQLCPPRGEQWPAKLDLHSDFIGVLPHNIERGLPPPDALHPLHHRGPRRQAARRQPEQGHQGGHSATG